MVTVWLDRENTEEQSNIFGSIQDIMKETPISNR